MSGYRLAAGGRIDRVRVLSFAFDGVRYEGYAGDTLASALIANGVDCVARSFKYHRPRGVMTAGPEEPNALVQLETGNATEPNSRATQIELYDGLNAHPINAWPSLRWDAASLSAPFARLLAAGFYYKTFKWPRSFWRSVYEPALRRMAGLGTAPDGPDPDLYDKIHAHVDILVIGGGPAGLTAALSASAGGARVMLADEQAELGGTLLQTRRSIGARSGPEWTAEIVADLTARPDMTILTRTTAFGLYDQDYVLLVERRPPPEGPVGRSGWVRQRLWHVRAQHIILATGAHERPLVFPNTDRPGIMLAGAVSCYLNRYAVAPGRRAVVATNNDGAYQTAFDLAAAGVPVEAIVDARSEPAGGLVALARGQGIEVIRSSVVAGATGRSRLDGVWVHPAGNHGVARRHLLCDLLAMSGGWSPSVHLYCQAQGRLRWDADLSCFRPAGSEPSSAGGANGATDLTSALAQGAAAGLTAAAAVGWPAPESGTVPVVSEPDTYVASATSLPIASSARPGMAFVDFQHDVTVADIRLSAREGFQSVEHMKRYTTAGMATDQGKTANVNALSLLAEASGRSIPEVGTTRFRPPYTPVTFGVLAGRDLGERLDPIRVTPMHEWHVAHNAVFENVGQWKRPWYYPRLNENMESAVRREAKAARSSLGVQDVSTLGKIGVKGPDAALFLDRIYTNGFGRLGVGRCRYGIMCRDDGMVFDDGVTTRLAKDHFFMTTTTGGAAPVLDWLEELLQTDWPDLNVYLTTVTDQWAATAIAGPNARRLMQIIAPGMRLEREEFPFLSMQTGEVASIPARVFRISFSGELAYEVHVDAAYGAQTWEAIIAAGQRFEITPYGTEAMHLLRAEKGFIIVGQDTDGTVTPLDLGMDWIVSKQKMFVGKRSLARADMLRPDRPQLVGLFPEDANMVLPEGVQLVETAGSTASSLGHVTSSYWSPNLGRSFALALVAGGRARLGTVVYAPFDGNAAAVRIVEPVFWDKKNERQSG